MKQKRRDRGVSRWDGARERGRGKRAVNSDRRNRRMLPGPEGGDSAGNISGHVRET